MLEVTKRLEFDSAHRVMGHEGHCKYLHGHRYVAEISVAAIADLDLLGRVVDFSVVKEKVGGWITDNWDHNIILNPGDPLLDHLNVSKHSVIFAGREPYLMPMTDRNPTVENMVRVLFYAAAVELYPHNVRLTRVRLYETPTAWADFSEPLELPK